MTQFSSCTNLTIDQLKSKNLTISISSMVCCVLTALILFLLIFYRAYKTVLQRFFLYLTTVSMLHLMFISMDIHLLLTSSHGPQFCKWLGFMVQWTANMTYFFVFVITMYLIRKVYQKLKSIPSININLQPKRLYCIVREVAVVGCVVLLPLTFLWVPFYNNTYGIYSTTCWIQKFDNHCNESIGSIEQIAMVSILRIVMIVVIVSFFILSVLFCRFAYYYRDTRKAHLKTIRQTFLLMCFFVVSSLIELTGLAMYIYTAITKLSARDSYIFWLAYDIAMPLSHLVIPSGFLVYLYSFQWKTIKRASGEWKATCSCSFCSTSSCCRTSSVSSSDSQREALTAVATISPSTRVSPPSQTYSVSVEYTGGFPSVDGATSMTRYGTTACN